MTQNFKTSYSGARNATWVILLRQINAGNLEIELGWNTGIDAAQD
ncbi:hypothetical protein [Candidatus Chlorohelix sp.]